MSRIWCSNWEILVTFDILTKPQALADAKVANESHYTSKIASNHLAEELRECSAAGSVSFTWEQAFPPGFSTSMAVSEDGSTIIVQLKDNEIDLIKVALAISFPPFIHS